jgi:hypothetical protein
MMKKQKDSAEKAIRDIRRAMARVSRVSSSLVGALTQRNRTGSPLVLLM